MLTELRRSIFGPSTRELEAKLDDLPSPCEMRARLGELERIINTPMIDDFVEAAANEARHQIDRWGDEHDAAKSPDDWRDLLGHLSKKAVDAFEAGDHEKGMHHIISSAAVLANWHRHAATK